MAEETAAPNQHKNEKVGEVVSTKMHKTIVVQVSRRVPHPLYRRIVMKHKKFYAHDEENTARVGDMVSVGFEDRLTFVLAGPNAKVPANQNVGAMAAASIGKSGAAVMDDDAIQTWWVTAVDPSAGTIALVNPAGGQIRTYSVSTPADREQLPRVKPGDNVTVVNHELLVVSISPKA